MGKRREKEIWVDYIKIFACVLVVLGHFFQSMTRANIVSESTLYLWFDKTIYYFHVPLFFICSGYLYQRNSKVCSVESWKTNAMKKIIVLGVPYLAFSFLTWILKKVFASSVNEQADGLLKTLFLQPSSPYWYLYCLFFVFLITPTIVKGRKIWMLGIAVVLKILSLIGIGTSIFAISSVMQNEIWFIAGMCMGFGGVQGLLGKRKILITGAVGFGGFLCLSILHYRMKISFWGIETLLGMMACVSVVAIFLGSHRENAKSKIMEWFSQYTLPIFLMHTIFAAAFRSVLMKLGIMSATLHVILGLVISFAGPILATIIMKKIKYLDLFLYPLKYIRIAKK